MSELTEYLEAREWFDWIHNPPPPNLRKALVRVENRKKEKTFHTIGGGDCPLNQSSWYLGKITHWTYIEEEEKSKSDDLRKLNDFVQSFKNENSEEE